jgi:predicted outer membrane protein
VQQALALSTVSLQQSNFALSKAQNPRLKQFADFEIGEQNLMTDIMHSFADPAATASTTAGAQQSASTAPELPQKDAAAMERMSRAQPGPAFDKEYVAMQIQGHQELLVLQENFLKNASSNREMTNVARLARGQIQEHLAMLQNIQKELGQ